MAYSGLHITFIYKKKYFARICYSRLSYGCEIQKVELVKMIHNYGTRSEEDGNLIKQYIQATNLSPSPHIQVVYQKRTHMVPIRLIGNDLIIIGEKQ